MNIARSLLILGAIWCASVISVSAQWVKQSVDTTASLRGLSVVNEKVIWASGTGGTVIRTIDGGKTWKVMTVPGAEKLDFRDIEAFDANTAYILSIGNGESSRIYKTTDDGNNWILQFKNSNEKAFFDAMACWDVKNCMAMSDPVDHKFVLIETKNGGETWSSMDTSKMPAAKAGEAAFAASGTCLITQGKTNAFLVTGGSSARVFRSRNRGRNWKVSDTNMISGTAGSGIFSISMLDARHGWIVGGDYEHPDSTSSNMSKTSDGGKTWRIQKSLPGYRSAVTHLEEFVLAVGTGGVSFSNDSGGQWSHGFPTQLNSVRGTMLMHNLFAWAVGSGGRVFRFTYTFNI